jgi:soluble lytic murein transglycosylase
VPNEFDDPAREWHARAALWAGDWKLASNIIAAMPDQQRTLARWRYWAARAAEKNGDPKLARQLYESVLLDDNFYSIMSAARLDRPVAPHPEKLVLDQPQVERMEELPAMIRARELLMCDMRSQAGSEWSFAFEQLSPIARTQAVHLAARWGWYEQAIATASLQRVFNDYQLLYPQPYDAEVLTAAKLTGLSPQLIYSIMRQESLYRRDALSSAGARGLLQMLPETARRTASKWNRPRPAADDLFNPVVNVPLGAANLRTLIDRFNGQTLVAIAGYNAGPNAAARWLPGESLDPDVWIENIPYNETRNYVQRILWHNVVFSWLRKGEPQKVDAWLARIAPLNEAAVLGLSEEGT